MGEPIEGFPWGAGFDEVVVVLEEREVNTSSQVKRRWICEGEVGRRWGRVETGRREKRNERCVRLGDRKGRETLLLMRTRREGREREIELRITSKSKEEKPQQETIVSLEETRTALLIYKLFWIASLQSLKKESQHLRKRKLVWDSVWGRKSGDKYIIP
jgi:hypothetical protein